MEQIQKSRWGPRHGMQICRLSLAPSEILCLLLIRNYGRRRWFSVPVFGLSKLLMAISYYWDLSRSKTWLAFSHLPLWVLSWSVDLTKKSAKHKICRDKLCFDFKAHCSIILKCSFTNCKHHTSYDASERCDRFWRWLP